jgi:hypothetical protein
MIRSVKDFTISPKGLKGSPETASSPEMRILISLVKGFGKTTRSESLRQKAIIVTG